MFLWLRHNPTQIQLTVENCHCQPMSAKIIELVLNKLHAQDNQSSVCIASTACINYSLNQVNKCICDKYIEVLTRKSHDQCCHAVFFSLHRLRNKIRNFVGTYYIHITTIDTHKQFNRNKRREKKRKENNNIESDRSARKEMSSNKLK